MIKEIKEEYFVWLVNKIKGQEHWCLLRHLHETPFHWQKTKATSNDENRAFDGQALRDRFLYETNYTGYSYNYPEEECSVFEMLVALAFRINDILIEIEEEDQMARWFWELLENLGIDIFNDWVYFEKDNPTKIEDIIAKWMDRKYDKNGTGGIFPRKDAPKDQRKVEIWYQMSGYLIENYQLEDVN